MSSITFCLIPCKIIRENAYLSSMYKETSTKMYKMMFVTIQNETANKMYMYTAFKKGFN